MKRCWIVNSRGISALFLIIAMLLMVIIGYVFSYLVPAKQKSVLFSVQSTQAFFIAQSGVEFAVRYASSNGWTTAALLDANLNGVSRNLGSGTFVLTYNSPLYGDTLISAGQVPANSTRRSIRLRNFTSFLSQLVLWIDPPSSYPAPCWITTNQSVRFFIKNISSADVVVDSFQANWTPNGNTRLRRIYMGTPPPPPLVQRFSGSYGRNGPVTALDSNQTILSGQVIQVEIFWQHARVAGDIVVTFYTTGGAANIIDVGTPSSNCS